MNLQTRKLNVIEYLINLQDDKIFSMIESAIFESKKQETKKVKSLTQKNLIERAKRANEDYKAGRVKTQKQIKKESENW
ncbi:MAG: hypothetical protein HXX09_13890 [Bacteroidetes bacterium]|nr:hypothetical protein [Bacteroidota bacterium]